MAVKTEGSTHRPGYVRRIPKTNTKFESSFKEEVDRDDESAVVKKSPVVKKSHVVKKSSTHNKRDGGASDDDSANYFSGLLCIMRSIL